MDKYEIKFSNLPNGMEDIKLEVNGLQLNPQHRIPVYLDPDPAFDKLAIGWADGLKLDDAKKTIQATVHIEAIENPDSPTRAFLKEWADRIRGEAMPQSMGFVVSGPYPIAAGNVEVAEGDYHLLPGETYTIHQNFDFEGSFQPEPRLETPYKLKWHRHGVNIIGADQHEFQMDILDGPFRSGRIARKWAKHKVKTQDTQIVGKVGTMRGMVMHTGLPKDK
jgi:hypothetical protein